MAPSSESEARVLLRIEQNAREQVSFIKKLIRIRSFPGTKQEGDAQKLLMAKLAEIGGIRVDAWEPKLREINAYPFHPIREEKDHWNYAGRPNVVGTLDGEEACSLILNGHIDVVSPEPVSAWTKDPWNGHEEGGRLYGRGANDMKAGLSSMVYALKGIVDEGFATKGRVSLQSVVEEEFGGGGTIATLLRGYAASAALVAEPSGSKNICSGTGGSRFFRITAMGRSETPQSFHRGVNAIDPAYRIYRALTRLNAQRQKRLRGRRPSFEKSGEGAMFGNGKVTNLVVGRFKAGDFPATVAGWAEQEGRVGFPTGERGKDVRSQIERAVVREARRNRWMRKNPPVVKWFNAQREPYELSDSEPIVSELKRCVEDVTGTEPTLFSTPSSADSVFLATRVGKLGGIPTVMYGPGGKNAHAADEFVYLREVAESTKAVALLVMRWCGLVNS